MQFFDLERVFLPAYAAVKFMPVSVSQPPTFCWCSSVAQKSRWSLLKKAKYRKYMMTFQVTDALAFLSQCWIICRDDGIADELELLSKEAWSYYGLGTTAYRGCNTSDSSCSIGGNGTFEERFRVKTDLMFIAKLFGWHLEIYKHRAYSPTRIHFLKCAVACKVSHQFLHFRVKSCIVDSVTDVLGGFLLIGDGKWYSVALFLRSNIL